MKTSIFAPALALAALASATTAQAQAACVDPGDFSDTVSYAVPLVYDALQEPCAGDFAQSSFMQSNGSAFVDRFRARQDENWAGTLRLLKVFMAKRGGETEESDAQMMALIEALPEDSLRPFVDAILMQVLNERLVSELKPTTCGDVAEAMELLDPLPPENMSGLIAFLARQADLKDPPICKAAGTSM